MMMKNKKQKLCVMALGAAIALLSHSMELGVQLGENGLKQHLSLAAYKMENRMNAAQV